MSNQALQQDDTNTVPLCHVNDLVADSGICALLPDGSQVALFYLPDQEENRIFALGNWDPIGKANVLSRGIVGDIGNTLVVASPLYKQHFRLQDGRCVEDETVSVPVYSVQIDGDQVLIQIS